jgi:hypothetical protein
LLSSGVENFSWDSSSFPKKHPQSDEVAVMLGFLPPGLGLALSCEGFLKVLIARSLNTYSGMHFKNRPL